MIRNLLIALCLFGIACGGELAPSVPSPAPGPLAEAPAPSVGGGGSGLSVMGVAALADRNNPPVFTYLLSQPDVAEWKRRRVTFSRTPVNSTQWRIRLTAELPDREWRKTRVFKEETGTLEFKGLPPETTITASYQRRCRATAENGGACDQADIPDTWTEIVSFTSQDCRQRWEVMDTGRKCQRKVAAADPAGPPDPTICPDERFRKSTIADHHGLGENETVAVANYADWRLKLCVVRYFNPDAEGVYSNWDKDTCSSGYVRGNSSESPDNSGDPGYKNYYCVQGG